jgi:hypothetical protein
MGVVCPSIEGQSAHMRLRRSEHRTTDVPVPAAAWDGIPAAKAAAPVIKAERAGDLVAVAAPVEHLHAA